ncbi:CoA transferase subunit A [bacterium]|nr:CoA transferase subunit A [bacterium]
MKTILSAKDAVSKIKDGSTIMVGGFLSCGTPDYLIDELINQNKKDLTMICNDTSYPDANKGKMIANKLVKKVITTHIGTNPEAGRQMHNKELEVELIPMGTFVEKIRAKGSGLGGILTQTGVGTVIQEGKKVMTVDGKDFIFEKPLGADYAIVYGTKVDKYGNISYEGTTRNVNVVMATAADTVIVQADELVDELNPNEVVVPGLFVDYIVVKEDK